MNLMYYHKNELRLHLNRPQWSSTQARARKHMTRARAQILISIVKSALLSRQTRSMTPICRLVKGYQNWYATSSGQPGDQSSVFYIIDIDWRWDQNIRIDAHYARNIYQNWIKTKFELVGLLRNIFPHFTPPIGYHPTFSGSFWRFFTDFSSFRRSPHIFVVSITILSWSAA